MYTLRIIDQTKVGAEERRNIFIGDEYSVLMSVPVKEEQEPMKEWDNKFSNAIKQFYGIQDGEPHNIEIDRAIVGFVYINDVTYPIRDFNVVYIVNKDGSTNERVYGQYVKY